VQLSRVVDGLSAWSLAGASNQREFASLYFGLLLVLEAPAVDLLDVETPVASDLERGQLPGPYQAIDGARMYFQIGCTFR
jgi:hypothetical protein